MKSIGVDIGGTFTDLIYFDPENGDVGIHKIATTPEDPSLGVIAGIKVLCNLNDVKPSDIVSNWGGFKRDKLDLNKLGIFRKKAIEIFDTSAWK